ncbi:TetR/AcrR family transcriptional regulator [Halalkalibacter hemicellulosilyticus]|uniref:Transcriptional regulator n=1 Tax=Halalkalibacter hemicellulosilyticusJCM 9152 TaxID=1236971 RepID=W4QCS4_9BACI|nr:TetR/AcrR family transcriptional regulator [Halalkalibacter hemicellulosilyticus]GAE29458.1 transcriptional regulator [Halalkalibacter hemicellulosilyticusJCM 9152]
MPSGFNKEEQEHIKEKLQEAGRRLFGSVGLKKTSIKDLTEYAGIAQGSFYKFYDSKEVLYFRLLEKDEEEIKQALMIKFASEKTMDESVLAEGLIESIKQVEQYPLIRRLYTTDEYEKVVRKLPKELLEEHGKEDTVSLAPLLDQLKMEGKIDSQLSNDVVSGALRALFLMMIHKKEIGEEVYEDSLYFLAEAVAMRVFKEVK